MMRRAHLDAIRAALAPLGYPVHFTEAPTRTLPDGTREVPEPPYLVVWESVSHMTGETLDDFRGDTDSLFGVTGTAGSPETALTVTDRVRALLAPGGMSELDVAGERAWIRHEDTRGVQVDRDVVAARLNRHPAFRVDMYRLTTTPD